MSCFVLLIISICNSEFSTVCGPLRIALQPFKAYLDGWCIGWTLSSCIFHFLFFNEAFFSKNLVWRQSPDQSMPFLTLWQLYAKRRFASLLQIANYILIFARFFTGEHYSWDKGMPNLVRVALHVPFLSARQSILKYYWLRSMNCLALHRDQQIFTYNVASDLTLVKTTMLRGCYCQLELTSSFGVLSTLRGSWGVLSCLWSVTSTLAPVTT